MQIQSGGGRKLWEGEIILTDKQTPGVKSNLKG